MVAQDRMSRNDEIVDLEAWYYNIKNNDIQNGENLNRDHELQVIALKAKNDAQMAALKAKLKEQRENQEDLHLGQDVAHARKVEVHRVDYTMKKKYLVSKKDRKRTCVDYCEKGYMTPYAKEHCTNFIHMGNGFGLNECA